MLDVSQDIFSFRRLSEEKMIERNTDRGSIRSKLKENIEEHKRIFHKLYLFNFCSRFLGAFFIL
jgi:hypothetical protein